MLKVCQVCGKEYEATSHAQKYCQACGPGIKEKVQRARVDKYRARHGVQVGAGSGKTQGRGKEHREYETGIATFQREKLESMDSYFCERCGKDLNNIVHVNNQLWCVHHIDMDRTHNEQSNWLLVCKSCHQTIHRAADHLNKRS
jgi:rRNA maturation endonuclease Nob1